MTATNSNVTAAKVATNAKRKAPSKAEIARKTAAKLRAKALSEAGRLTLDEARTNVVRDTGKASGAARVYAHALIERFGADYYTFTAANCRTDNEKAHLAAIEEERKRCAAEYATKFGEEGKNMPWSRAKAVAKQLREGGEPRPGKPLDEKQKASLTSLYKAGMKEERATEQELQVNDAIGRILIAAFKVDLSTLG